MKDDLLAPLFISLTNRRYHQRMTNDEIAFLVKQARKTAKLTRHITPHILRHSGASYDGGYLTEQDLCLKYRWVVGSDMARRYCHTSENRLAERLKKIAGVNDNEQQERKCPRCGESNSIHAENCVKCNQILDFKKLTEELEKRKEQQKEINELEKELKKEIADLQTELEKKTEIDNFIMDSLGVIAGEMVHTEGIEAVKELFCKHNIRLAGD